MIRLLVGVLVFVLKIVLSRSAPSPVFMCWKQWLVSPIFPISPFCISMKPLDFGGGQIGLKVHFAESWNELHHLLIMESLGGNLNSG